MNGFNAISLFINSTLLYHNVKRLEFLALIFSNGYNVFNTSTEMILDIYK